MPCACPACSLRRLAPPVTLIVLGMLLLAHMLRPAFSTPLLIAVFLLYGGVATLLIRLAPHAADAGHVRRRSLFVPVLLLLAGGLLLVRVLHPALPLGYWIATYWPLLLILWGLIRILEHYTHPPRMRPGFSAGEVLLVLLIIFGGLGFSAAYRYGHSRWANVWGVNVDAWNPFLSVYTFSGSASSALAPKQRVVIAGYHGNVRLQASAGAQVSAAVDDTVRAPDPAAAQQVFQGAQPQIRTQGDVLLVLPAGAYRGGNLQTALVLTLPASTPVEIQMETGNIEVADWAAAVTVQAQHASISADRIAGAVTISGGGGDVAVSNVTGPVSLQGRFFGALSFRNCAQGVHVSLNRPPGNAEIRVGALTGGLDLEPGRITLDGAQNVNLTTRDQEVRVRDFTGPLNVETRNQPVSLTAAAAPAAPITVSDQNADITLTLPAGSQFQFDAQLRNGRASNAFEPMTAPANAPLISATTSNGDIRIRKGAAAIARGAF